MSAIRMSIAGVVYEFTFDCPEFFRRVQDKYAAFFTENEPVGLMRVSTYTAAGRAADDTSVNISIGEKNIIGTREGHFEYRMDSETLCGRVSMLSSAAIFDMVVRTLYSVILLRYGGVLVHSAGVVHDNRGYVFPGPSECGKTTLAQDADRHSLRVIGDDITAIRRYNGQYFLFGTPFWGLFSGTDYPSGAPLAALYTPVKSDRCRVVPQDTSEGVVTLMQSILNFTGNRQSNVSLLRIATDIIDCVTHPVLYFTKSDNIWNRIIE
jgi:hypothetical protein